MKHGPDNPNAEGPVAFDAATFGYGGDAEAVAGVSAVLRAGRVTALIGPNAAGKTTLLRLALGQVRPGSGSVALHGRPAASWDAGERARRVAYVPQRGSAAFGFSARRVVAMGRHAWGDTEHVGEALRRVGLHGEADRPVAELSGGQQQRVWLARAWAQSRGAGGADPAEASVVLADEPTSGQDLGHAHASLGLLRELAGEGRAVLAVLHGLDEAARWADEVWLMHGGQLVAAGPREAVLVPGVLGPAFGVTLEAVAGGAAWVVAD
ncbi:MAG: ABC transporter ATP-binding protein [Planctomycetota bacterium]